MKNETTIALLGTTELSLGYDAGWYDVLMVGLHSPGAPSSTPGERKEPSGLVAMMNAEAIDEAIEFLSEARDAIATQRRIAPAAPALS